MRSLTSAVQTAIDSENIIPVWLAELDFPSGFVRLNTGPSEITFGGNAYQGAGQLAGVSPILETEDLQASGLDLTLSGIPNDKIAIALAEQYQGRAAKLWLAFLDSGHRLIANPVGPWTYAMDAMDVSLAESASVRLAVVNRLDTWDRPRSRRYNDADQQSEYAGDLGLQYLEESAVKTVFWGRVNAGFN